MPADKCATLSEGGTTSVTVALEVKGGGAL